MRPKSPRRAVVAVSILAASAVTACSFSSDISVHAHELRKPLEVENFVNSYNVVEKLDQGFIPEVLQFFQASSSRSMEGTRFARTLGQALLERGDFRLARTYLERSYGQEGRFALRGETAWLIAQACYWMGDFQESARWTVAAQSEGHGVPKGWVAFLESAGARKIYGGSEPGTRLSMNMIYGRPNLIRIPVVFEGKRDEELVLDSGASISLLTESAAKRLGIEPVPGAVATAYGLHQTELPMRFGWAESVHIGGVTLTHVPFGILEDDALTFQTTLAGSFKIAGVLGVHLMKEFDWRLEYHGKKIRGIRVDGGARGSRDQNVFFRRLKPMVRASFNRQPWFLFLLDTGAEPTMVTRTGISRSWSSGLESSYPMTLEGIGKSRVSWAKISNVDVGIDRFMVKFKDLVVKEDSGGLEDGVVGSSFLSSFDVELRFSTMTLSLQRPYERFLHEETAGPPLPSLPAR